MKKSTFEYEKAEYAKYLSEVLDERIKDFWNQTRALTSCIVFDGLKVQQRMLILEIEKLLTDYLDRNKIVDM